MSPPTVEDHDQHDEGDDARPEAQGRRRRRWLVAVVAVAAVAAGIALVVTVTRDGGGADDAPAASDDPAGAPDLPPPVEPEVDAEGESLLDLLEAGRDATYHATYVASGDAVTVGTELTLEVWHRDGLVRQDSRQVTDAGTVETAGFRLEDDRAIVCQRIDEGEWTCAEQAQTSSDVFGSIVAQLEGQDVVETTEEIGGRQARCFSFTGPDGEVGECLTDDGIPVRLRGPGTELLLSEVGDDVPDDVFEPPAEPVTGEVNP